MRLMQRVLRAGPELPVLALRAGPELPVLALRAGPELPAVAALLGVLAWVSLPPPSRLGPGLLVSSSPREKVQARTVALGFPGAASAVAALLLVLRAGPELPATPPRVSRVPAQRVLVIDRAWVVGNRHTCCHDTLQNMARVHTHAHGSSRRCISPTL